MPGLNCHDADFSHFVIGSKAALRLWSDGYPIPMTAGNASDDVVVDKAVVRLRRPQHKGLLFAPQVHETARIDGKPVPRASTPKMLTPR